MKSTFTLNLLCVIILSIMWNPTVNAQLGGLMKTVNKAKKTVELARDITIISGEVIKLKRDIQNLDSIKANYKGRDFEDFTIWGNTGSYVDSTNTMLTSKSYEFHRKIDWVYQSEKQSSGFTVFYSDTGQYTLSAMGAYNLKLISDFELHKGFSLVGGVVVPFELTTSSGFKEKEYSVEEMGTEIIMGEKCIIYEIYDKDDYLISEVWIAPSLNAKYAGTSHYTMSKYEVNQYHSILADKGFPLKMISYDDEGEISYVLEAKTMSEGYNKIEIKY